MVKPIAAPADAESLKKFLHQKIDSLNASRLSLLNRVIFRLEAEEIATELDTAFDFERKAGRLSNQRVEDILASIRGEHPYE